MEPCQPPMPNKDDERKSANCVKQNKSVTKKKNMTILLFAILTKVVEKIRVMPEKKRSKKTDRGYYLDSLATGDWVLKFEKGPLGRDKSRKDLCKALSFLCRVTGDTIVKYYNPNQENASPRFSFVNPRIDNHEIQEMARQASLCIELASRRRPGEVIEMEYNDFHLLWDVLERRTGVLSSLGQDGERETPRRPRKKRERRKRSGAKAEQPIVWRTDGWPGANQALHAEPPQTFANPFAHPQFFAPQPTPTIMDDGDDPYLGQQQPFNIPFVLQPNAGQMHFIPAPVYPQPMQWVTGAPQHMPATPGCYQGEEVPTFQIIFRTIGVAQPPSTAQLRQPTNPQQNSGSTVAQDGSTAGANGNGFCGGRGVTPDRQHGHDPSQL